MGGDGNVSASGRRLHWIALGLLTLALIVAVGVLFQYRLRGGSSPEEIAKRSVSAVRNGDRMSFFLLSHPDHLLRPAFDARIERYRGASADRVAIRYELDPVAS